MTEHVIEKKLFLVKSTLSVYPVFYVKAEDILKATDLAKTIVDFYANDKVVGAISTIDTPLLDIVEMEE